MVGLALTAATGPAWASCEIQGLSFADVDFTAVAPAQKKCDALLSLIGDTSPQDCQVVRINLGNGQVITRATLRTLTKIQGNGVAQAAAALEQIILTNHLFGDQSLGLQLTTNGQCAQ